MPFTTPAIAPSDSEIEEHILEGSVVKKRSPESLSENTPLLAKPEEPTEGLPLWRQASYAIGNFSRYAVLGIQAFYINAFLLEVANLDAYSVAAIQIIKQGYDAAMDPIIGRVSDGIRTRYGRRKPFILLGTLPQGIFWILMWWSPPYIINHYWAKFFYYLITNVIFSSCHTIVSVPYNAMTPDVCKTFSDRTTIVLLQNVVGLSAIMIYGTAQAYLIELFPVHDMGGDTFNYQKGYFIASLVSVGAISFPPLWAILFVQEKELPPAESYGGVIPWIKNFLKGMLSALMFWEFMCVAIIFLLDMLAVYLFLNNFVFFVKYNVKAEQYLSYLVFVSQLAIMISFFMWSFLSLRLGKDGKKATYIIGITLWNAANVGLFFVKDDSLHSIVLLFACVLGRGVGCAVAYQVPMALIPDIVQVDEEKNSIRREGILYSIMILFQKSALAIILSLSSLVLGWAGYENVNFKHDHAGVLDNYQPPSVVMTLRIMVSIVPVVLLIPTYIILYFVPTVHREQLPEPIFEEPTPRPKRSLFYFDSKIKTDSTGMGS